MDSLERLFELLGIVRLLSINDNNDFKTTVFTEVSNSVLTMV